jgi:DNA (cytosine-5)-methyltransferase 1
VTAGEALKGLGKPHLKEPGTTHFDDKYRNHVDVTPVRDRARVKYIPEGSFLAAQTHLPEDLLRGLTRKDTTKFLRLNRKKPSNTLRCGEIFFHPTEDRYLTPREYMRIHGYPDSYLLKGPIRSRTGTVKNLDQHRQVANSVPPPLAFVMATQIREYIEKDM